MLDQVLSVCLVDLGSTAERDRSLVSVSALGVPCVRVGPGPGPGLGDRDGGHGGDGGAGAGDATLGELLAVGYAAVTTPWALVLVAGETVRAPDPAALVAALESVGALSVAPWTWPAEELLPDPLRLTGARLVRVTGEVPVARWAIGEELYPTESAAPYLIESRRAPFEAGTAAARWGIAVAGRRMRERGDAGLPAADGLLDASLLAWSSESQGALSAASRVLGESQPTATERALAARIQFGAALADGRAREAIDGLDLWAAAAPDDPSLRQWRLLMREMDQQLTDPGDAELGGTGAGGAGGAGGASEPGESGELADGWLTHAIVGFSGARYTKAGFEVDLCFGYVDSWARTASVPSIEMSRVVLDQLITRWRRMGRPAADLVARWPEKLIDLLVDYLEVGDASEPLFWLALGLACTEKKPPTEGMLARAELMIGQMQMSDALLWTIRAKEGGHGDHSLLRRRATSNLFGPRDRVLAAALALQHAGDAGAEPLLQAAAAQCDPTEFAKLLADLSALASGAIPSFVSGGSTTEERAQAMVVALRDAGIVRNPESGEIATGNRAQRRAERRGH